MRRGRPTRERAQIKLHLKARGPEIQQAILTRLYGIADPSHLDPPYIEGLQSAVAAAVDYALDGIERGEAEPPPVPPALLAQARLAARNGVSLDTVLRRYVAGHSILADYLVEQGSGALGEQELKRLLRSQASLLDNLIAAVSEEHARAREERPRSAEERRTERIRRLLAGELIEMASIPYDFEGSHLGILAVGAKALETLRAAAATLDRALLAVWPEPEVLWAWLGGRGRLDPAALAPQLEAAAPKLLVAVGEPADGLEGWRLSHRQATAAMAVAVRRDRGFVRYAEVALLAAVLKDELLATSLKRLYVAPLRGERDGGRALLETLRTYLATDRNSASAAATLGVTRQTVNNRLHAIEERIGRPLGTCASELDVALQLDQLEGSAEGA